MRSGPRWRGSSGPRRLRTDFAARPRRRSHSASRVASLSSWVAQELARQELGAPAPPPASERHAPRSGDDTAAPGLRTSRASATRGASPRCQPTLFRSGRVLCRMLGLCELVVKQPSAGDRAVQHGSVHRRPASRRARISSTVPDQPIWRRSARRLDTAFVARPRSTGAGGMSRATGVPHLVMVMTSPLSAASRRRERWLFASEAPMNRMMDPLAELSG